jgi:adenylate cyclase
MVDSTDDRNFNPFWHAMLSGEHPALRRGGRMLRLLSPTASVRCRLCFAGFDGFTAPAMRLMGRAPVAAQSAFLREVRGGFG